MKKCPYCAEEVQDEAIKCRFCNEFFDKKQKAKWYFKPTTLFIGFLCVGPLVLPLVWLNPDHSAKKKVALSIIILIITYVMGVFFAKAFGTLSNYYQAIFSGF